MLGPRNALSSALTWPRHSHWGHWIRQRRFNQLNWGLIRLQQEFEMVSFGDSRLDAADNLDEPAVNRRRSYWLFLEPRHGDLSAALIISILSVPRTKHCVFLSVGFLVYLVR